MKTIIFIIVAFVVAIGMKGFAQTQGAQEKHEMLNALIEKEGIIVNDDSTAIFTNDCWVISKEGNGFWVQNEINVREAYILTETRIGKYNPRSRRFEEIDDLFLPISKMEVSQVVYEKTKSLKFNKWSIKGLSLGKVNNKDNVKLIKKQWFGMRYVFQVKIDDRRSVIVYLTKRWFGSFILDKICTGYLPTLDSDSKNKATRILLYALDKRE